MLNEVELLEEIPYYRTLQQPKPPSHHHHQHHFAPHQQHYPTAPRGGFRDDTAIAIIAPDIRPMAPVTASAGGGGGFDGGGERYAPPAAADLLLGLAGHAAALAADLAACYVLAVERRLLWAALAAACVLVAALVVNAVSICWYVRGQRSAVYAAPGKATWVARAIFHLCFMGLLYRYLHLLFNCLCGDRLEEREHRSVMEARKRRNALLQLSMREDRQTATLGLLHSLLESAPQLVLQLYTLAHRTDADSQTVVLVQGASAASSLFHLSWSITAYNSTLHRTVPGKRRTRAGGRLLHFLWHFCTVGSRACTLALFTKEYHYWLFPFCIGHWGVMAIWVMHQQTRLCRRKDGELRQCREYLGNMAVGVAYVIYYLNVKAEPTRYKYSAYYAIVFAENCALMTLWFLRNDPGAWYHIPALVAVFSSFASGIVFMLFYYGFCHRTLKQTNEKRAAHCC